MKSRFVCALIAGIIGIPPALTPTAASSAAAVVPPAETGAVFNNPEGDHDQQYAIIDHVIKNVEASADYAESADAHPTVRVVIYSLSVPSFADALTDAHERGVNVQVIMDYHAINPMWTQFAAGLNRDLWSGDTSLAKTCGAGGACLTGYDGSSVHAKYYSFSLGGQWAVTLSSANPTITQAEIAWNHAYTVAGNTTLYNAFLNYFNALKNGTARRQPDYYRYTNTEPRAYFFPKQGGSDTVEDILDNVSSCSGTTVRIAMFEWTIGRRNLASKLVAMGRAGCQIKILLTDGAVDAAVKTTLANKPNVTVTDTSKGDGCEGPYACHYTHSKYFMIKGKYLGVAGELVFAGSPNWTVNGLRHNDEVLEKINDPAVYATFLENFNAQAAAVTAPARARRQAATPQEELPVRPSELRDS